MNQTKGKWRGRQKTKKQKHMINQTKRHKTIRTKTNDDPNKKTHDKPSKKCIMNQTDEVNRKRGDILDKNYITS